MYGTQSGGVHCWLGHSSMKHDTYPRTTDVLAKSNEQYHHITAVRGESGICRVDGGDLPRACVYFFSAKLGLGLNPLSIIIIAQTGEFHPGQNFSSRQSDDQHSSAYTTSTQTLLNLRGVPKKIVYLLSSRRTFCNPATQQLRNEVGVTYSTITSEK